MYLLNTILPIFAVIFLGWAARKRGFLPPEFLEPANRLVYYLAIPAMIFHGISKASLKVQFDIRILSVMLISVLVVFAFAWIAAILLRVGGRRRGTFIQSAFHGNLGYIGLAVVFYGLGSDGFVRASILAGFIMILQNFLAVLALQFNGSPHFSGNNFRALAAKILGNPVIVSAFAGILFSLMEFKMPILVDRSLDILSGMALPMALLIIGASLSINLLRQELGGIALPTLMKLLLLPYTGFLLFNGLHIAPELYLPGLILLASPTATLTYVMAREMNGDPDLAVAAVSGSTLLSAVTMAVLLNLAG